MDISEIQRRSALVPRLREGRPMLDPPTARHISQLLLDEVSAMRTFVRSEQPPDAHSDLCLARVIGLACQLAPMVGTTNLAALLNKFLPKEGGTNAAPPIQQ